MNYSNSGTNILPTEAVTLAKIVDITFANNFIFLHLSDGRIIQLDITKYPWLRWLHDATPEQRDRWEIVPSGGGVWWPELDDGIELQPLLDIHPLI